MAQGALPRTALVRRARRINRELARLYPYAHIELNSHLGDARATETAARGELNVGQLVRERHPADCRLIG